MTVNSLKVSTWAGRNKTRVRLLKLFEIKKLLKENPDYVDRDEDWEPHYLTFSGPHALLERMLVNQGLVPAENIVTIQTYRKLGQKHDGKELLAQLIKTQKKYLKGMNIWPHDFSTFSKCYTLDGVTKPSDNKRALWSKSPYKKYMERVLSSEPQKFSILDLDFCGIFNENNSNSVINLFNNKLLESTGVSFVTHQKGRDVRNGKLFEILHDYLKKCPWVDFETIPKINDEKSMTHVARYVLIPLYYMCKAYENNYVMELSRLVEYRDLGDDSSAAVNMLQYFFKWFEADVIKDSYTHHRLNLEEVINSEYSYHRWLK